MSFAKYAATVKNLRGVIAADPSEEGALEKLKQLAKLYRYRELGIVPSTLRSTIPELAKQLKSRPFRELALPLPALETLPRMLHASLKLPLEAAEALVYASAYVAPALLIGEKLFESLIPLASGAVLTCKEMDKRLWKLHLRIADYTILDFYEECIDEALEVLAGSDPEPLLRNRLERVRRDAKRYWRVRCEEGRPLLLYVDNLALAARAGNLENLDASCAPALAIVPVVNLSLLQR
ncbi:MAG: hypothetical protein QXQ34_02595 [Thermofilum sp.]